MLPHFKHDMFFSDKGGDVIKYDVMSLTSEGVCILGHLSMLLDVTTTTCGQFIISCDRDEKIRVSRYPKAYSINNFCLGHTEFVAGLAICPHQTSILISASGDGTIRVWDFLSGKLLNSKLAAEDLPESLQRISETNPDAERARNGSAPDLRVKRSPIPGLTSIQCRKVSGDKSLVAVTVEK